MNRIHSLPLLNELATYLDEERNHAHQVLHHFVTSGRHFLLRSDILDGLRTLCEDDEDCLLGDTPLARVLQMTQEAALDANWFYVSLRPRIGRWHYLRIHLEAMEAEEIAISQFLRFKERLVNGNKAPQWMLEVDLDPFSREFLKPQEARSIGRGVEFLNRRLSSRLFEEQGLGQQRILDFLSMHSYQGRPLMLNGLINTVDELRGALRSADDLLATTAAEQSWTELARELGPLGFEAGWGCDAASVRASMHLLLDILEAPAPDALETFLVASP